MGSTRAPSATWQTVAGAQQHRKPFSLTTGGCRRDPQLLSRPMRAVVAWAALGALSAAAAALSEPDCQVLGIDIAFAIDASKSMSAQEVVDSILFVNQTAGSLRLGPR